MQHYSYVTEVQQHGASPLGSARRRTRSQRHPTHSRRRMCITGIEPWLASASHDNLGLPCVECAAPAMLAHTSTSLLASNASKPSSLDAAVQPLSHSMTMLSIFARLL